VVIADAKATTLLPILKERIVPDSIVYSDARPSYNALDVTGFRHLRINHSKLFADGKNHINGMEHFWNQAQRHLRKFNDVPKAHFPLFLKEGEALQQPKPTNAIKSVKSMGSTVLNLVIRDSPFIKNQGSFLVERE